MGRMVQGRNRFPCKCLGGYDRESHDPRIVEVAAILGVELEL